MNLWLRGVYERHSVFFWFAKWLGPLLLLVMTLDRCDRRACLEGLPPRLPDGAARDLRVRVQLAPGPLALSRATLGA